MAPMSQIAGMHVAIIASGAAPQQLLLLEAVSFVELGSGWPSLSSPATAIVAKICWSVEASPCRCLRCLSMTASPDAAGCLDDAGISHPARGSD